MKYIHFCHLDYWFAIHSIENFTPEKNAGELEFWITDDKEGDASFFRVDLYNTLQKGQADYFIEYLYYPTYDNNQVGNGYDYISPVELGGKTVFELKNKLGTPPDGAALYIREPGPLFPETVIGWMEKLSEALFGQSHKFTFANADVYDKEKAWLCFQGEYKLRFLED